MVKKVFFGVIAVLISASLGLLSVSQAAAYSCIQTSASTGTGGYSSSSSTGGYTGSGGYTGGGGTNTGAGTGTGTHSGGYSSSGTGGYTGSGGYVSPIAPVDEGECTSIFPNSWCTGGNGIASVINLIVTILTGAVVVAGTIGIIICGFLWMTARDNEAQVAKAKKRMIDIVIGIVAWILLALIANLFIPKDSTKIQSDAGISQAIQIQSLATNYVEKTATGYCSQKATQTKAPLSYTDSTDVACADGTTDLGIADAYSNGSKYKIRLCSVSSIRSTSHWDSDGHPHVDARVSAAYYALGKAVSFTVNDSYRSNEVQAGYRSCWNKAYPGGNSTGSVSCTINGKTSHLTAKPANAGWSDHQTGMSVDTSDYNKVNSYLNTYGFTRCKSWDPVHIDVIGSRTCS